MSYTLYKIRNIYSRITGNQLPVPVPLFLLEPVIIYVTDGLLHWNARDTQVDFEDEQYKFNELDPHEWSENIQIFPKI